MLQRRESSILRLITLKLLGEICFVAWRFLLASIWNHAETLNAYKRTPMLLETVYLKYHFLIASETQ